MLQTKLLLLRGRVPVSRFRIGVYASMYPSRELNSNSLSSASPAFFTSWLFLVVVTPSFSLFPLKHLSFSLLYHLYTGSFFLILTPPPSFPSSYYLTLNCSIEFIAFDIKGFYHILNGVCI